MFICNPAFSKTMTRYTICASTNYQFIFVENSDIYVIVPHSFHPVTTREEYLMAQKANSSYYFTEQ
jgi:hypothetical protein